MLGYPFRASPWMCVSAGQIMEWAAERSHWAVLMRELEKRMCKSARAFQSSPLRRHLCRHWNNENLCKRKNKKKTWLIAAYDRCARKHEGSCFPSNLQLIDLMSADDAGSDVSTMSDAVINENICTFLISINTHTQGHYITAWKSTDHCHWMWCQNVLPATTGNVTEWVLWLWLVSSVAGERPGALKAQWCADCEWLANGDLNLL